MKKIITFALIAAIAVCASGCDFVRQIAGRPTSKEIAVMAQQKAECEQALDTCTHNCSGCAESDGQCQGTCEKHECQGTCEKHECQGTCEKHECQGTCEKHECQGTCEKHECQGTCEKHECQGTCEKHECQGTCEKHECQGTCEKHECQGTCEKHECQDTCEKHECQGTCEKHECQGTCEKAEPAPVAEAQPQSFRYYVILGSFADSGNAARVFKAAEKHNLNPSYLKITRKLTTVGVCPTNDRKEALGSLKQCKSLKFCPADAYIYEQK